MNIIGILLAAGQSTRFGRDKLTEPFDQSSIAITSARKLLPHVTKLLIVVDPDNTNLIQSLSNINADILPCHNAKMGLGYSIRCGIKSSPECDGWLLALADMPFILPDTYADIIRKTINNHKIIAPLYQNQRGHPVFFAREFRNQLMNLNGDIGARDLLRTHKDMIYTLDTQDKGVIHDVDFPHDLV